MIQPIRQASGPYLAPDQPDDRILSGLDIWDGMKTIWAHEGLETSFFGSPSVAEINSFRILLEWWEDETRKCPPSEEARKQLQAFSRNDGIIIGERPPSLIYSTDDVAGNDTEPDENIKSAKHVGSNYNEQLFKLFQQEFCGYNGAETPSDCNQPSGPRTYQQAVSRCSAGLKRLAWSTNDEWNGLFTCHVAAGGVSTW